MNIIRASLARSAGAILFVNGVGFGVTAVTATHKITDLCGTAGFVASAAVVLRHAPKPVSLPAMLLGAGVIGWGTRLGGYLFVRVLETKDDERLRIFFRAEGEGMLDAERSFFPLNLLGFWTLQSLWGFIVSLPATLAIAAPVAVPFGVVGVAGAACFGGGLALETVADYQKYQFKSQPENKKRFCDAGVWSWSRHPNYFGEIMLWCGITLLAAPVLLKRGNGGLPALACASLSPAMTAGLLLGVSGVPMLERQHDEKYSADTAYTEWKRRTPELVPDPWAHTRGSNTE